ncbi:hypothetical protein V2W45_1467269 [Cenococcum geophilum]
MSGDQVIAALFTTFGIQVLLAGLSTRQSGGPIATINGCSTGGCTSLIETFPIFNSVNMCQSFASGFTVVSTGTVMVVPGCSVFLWSSIDCSGTLFLGPVDTCVQRSALFQSINVIYH